MPRHISGNVPPLPPWIARRGIAVLDLETTGRELRSTTVDGRTQRELDVERMEPIQVAVVVVHFGAEPGSVEDVLGDQPWEAVWTRYIRPVGPDGDTKSIPKGATDIHGITNEHVKDAPTLAELWPELKEQLAGRVLVTYNGARFDVPGLVAALKRAGVTGVMPDPYRQIDLMPWVREVDRWVKGPGRHTLVKTAERHGVLVSKYQAHRADADAMMTRDLFFALTREHPWALYGGAQSFYRQQAAAIEKQEADFAAWREKQKSS